MNKNRYVIEVDNCGKWLRSLNASSISGKPLSTVTFSEEAALREVEYQKSTNRFKYRYVLSAASVAAQEREASQEKFKGLVVQALELLTNFAAEASQRLGKLEAEPVPTPSLVETPTRTVLALERIADVLEARLPWGYPNTPPFMEMPPFLPNTTYYPPNTITSTTVSSGTP